MKTRNPLDLFIVGARKGWNVGVMNIMPNLVMAYAIAEVLKILGVLSWLGHVCSPIMGVFNLPGEAIMVLLTGWLSTSAGIGMAANFFQNGTLTSAHITILFAGVYLMGAQLQYMGRLLGVAEVPKRYWPLLCFTSILNAVVAMFVMRFFVG